MRYLCILTGLLSIFFMTGASAAPHACQSEVERKEAQLAREAFSQPEEDKDQLINGLLEASSLPGEELIKLIRLIENPKNIVYRFGKEDGVWISIVDKDNCRISLTTKTYAF